MCASQEKPGTHLAGWTFALTQQQRGGKLVPIEPAGYPMRKVLLMIAATLLMCGERDRWISPKHVPLWQHDLPGIQVKVYPGVGHIPIEEIPQQSAAYAMKFLLS